MSDIVIGGDLRVNRLGYGAMRLSGDPGIFTPPKDRTSAIAVLRRAVELGVNFIDTADAYGPRRQREPHRRSAPPVRRRPRDRHQGRQHPPHRRRMGALRPALLHPPAGRTEPAPLERRARSTSTSSTASTRTSRSPTRSKTVADLQRQGKIRHIGLSEVTVDQLKEAQDGRHRSSSVQNLYNLINRPERSRARLHRRAGHRVHPVVPHRRRRARRPRRTGRQDRRRSTARPRPRPRWRGCCDARTTSCRSRARARSPTSRRTSAPATSCSPTPRSRPSTSSPRHSELWRGPRRIDAGPSVPPQAFRAFRCEPTRVDFDADQVAGSVIDLPNPTVWCST